MEEEKKDMSPQEETVSQKLENSSKPSKTVNRGVLLEYRIQRLLFHMGYFSKVGIELRTSQEIDSEIITDLDVYGVYIHKDFRYKTVWADCKSGRARPLERISWLKGIKETNEIDDIFFVKGGVKSTIKNFARKLDIQILDTSLLDRLERNFSIVQDDWSGSWNPEIQLNKLKNFSKLTVPSNDIYKRISKFISTDYWSMDKYTKIKKCITAFRELANVPLEGLTKEQVITIKWGIYELTTLFVLSLLNIIRELYYFSDYERRNSLRDGLVSGEISIKKRTELVTASYHLAFELMRAQNPEFIPPASFTKMVSISPPSYFEELDDLLARIINNPLGYFDILRILDYMLMEYDLQEKEYDFDRLNNMFGDLEDKTKGIKTILHFICQITGIPKSYFKIIS